MSGFTTVQIDGEMVDPATASIPVTDIGFIRGYGVFEVMRVFDGVCFRLVPHLERLAKSAAMLGIDLPPVDELKAWCNRAASGMDSCMIRLLVSAGDDPFETPARVVVASEPLPSRELVLTLHPLSAPWHSDGAEWELLGAKTLSYGNNFGAIRQAKLHGFDDALLIGRSGRVLEGPSFSVGWVVEEDGRAIYETPSLTLGILESITRQLAFDAAEDAGIEIREVEVGLERLEDASEFFALSTLRDTLSVTSVGERAFPVGPHTTALREAMADRTARELASIA